MRYRDRIDAVREFTKFVSKHPGLRYAASTLALDELGEQAATLGVVTTKPYDYAVVVQREPEAHTTANLDGYVVYSTGPDEVNLDYYSSWESGRRLVVLDPGKGAARWPHGWLVLKD